MSSLIEKPERSVYLRSDFGRPNRPSGARKVDTEPFFFTCLNKSFGVSILPGLSSITFQRKLCWGERMEVFLCLILFFFRNLVIRLPNNESLSEMTYLTARSEWIVFRRESFKTLRTQDVVG